MNGRNFKHVIGKWMILSLTLLAVMAGIQVDPARAETVEHWSQYGRMGIVQGTEVGAFNGAYGVAVDHDGNVYVADRQNHRVQKWTAATNTWSILGSSGGGGPGELSFPTGVAVDNDGNVYVADGGNQRIQKLSVDTGTWTVWSRNGGGSGTGLGEFSAPAGVAVDSAGNIYVADSNNNRIQKWTIATQTWSEWKKSGGGSGSGLGEFNNPTSVVGDAAGNMYVADSNNNRVQKWTADTSTWSEIGSVTSPRGVFLDEDGNLYIAGNDLIAKLTASTNTWSEWKKAGGGAGSGLGEFNGVYNVAIDTHGNVYAADASNNRIQKWTAATDQWSEMGLKGFISGSGWGEFSSPSGVAIDHNANVYIADTQNHRIQKLASATNAWSEWKKSGGGSGSGLGEFNAPTGVAVDSVGNLYVADRGNQRVQKWTAATDTWSEWKKSGGGSGTGLGEFNLPVAIAVDSLGNLYVVDTLNHRVQKWTAATETWSEWKKNGGGSGSGLGEFTNPSGVTVDSLGNVYVTDRWHRIQKWTAATEQWTEWKKSGGGSGSELGEFNSATGVFVDRAGNLYVADRSNHRIQKWTATTDTWSEWKRSGGGIGSGLGEFNLPNSVAADGAGNLYVLDTNRLQKLTVVPSEAASLTATAGDRQVTLNWNTVTNATYYEIYRGTSSQSYDVGPVATVTGITYQVTGLTNGTTYYFALKAGNLAGTGLTYSNEAIATPQDPLPPVQPADPADPPIQQPVAEDKSVQVLINGKVENAGTAATTTVNNQTVTTITVDPKKLADKLAAEGDGVVITIPVNTGSDVVVGELNGQMVNSMEQKKAVVEIKTANASYTLPAGQINIGAISQQVGAGVALQDIKVRIEIAEPTADSIRLVESTARAGNFEIVAPPLEFKVSAVHGDRTIEVSKFNAYVERMISIPTGMDPSKITTGVVVEADGTVRHVPTQIVQIEGKYYAKINSLTNSIYSVVWHPLAFGDMTGHWAEAPVNDMGSRMVINGMSNGVFAPDQTITRAEFAAIIVRGLGLKLEKAGGSFADVRPTDWHSNAIQTAYAYKLIDGFEDGTFRPMDQITREQAMTIMAHAMQVTGLEAKLSVAEAAALLGSFRDAGSASAWALDGIAACLQAGLVSGRGEDQLAPQAPISRAEAAVIVQRLLQKSDLI
ncbi:S-layer homology domain-containing protein [Paenibacillus koleovorans]|uniref:S-layer homology domain-containing protein n=1 Tax=Paenibacillus koleovorans TaxID=121608 RepID=UPI000FDC5277|nr:S-layer homology domain-containing protein [Paenibacillus koleovorans]